MAKKELTEEEKREREAKAKALKEKQLKESKEKLTKMEDAISKAEERLNALKLKELALIKKIEKLSK